MQAKLLSLKRWPGSLKSWIRSVVQLLGLSIHFDFYRLDDPTEALDIGIEEYFYSGNYCWLEWAENIEAFLPENFFLIKIESISDLKRQVTFQHIHDAI